MALTDRASTNRSSTDNQVAQVGEMLQQLIERIEYQQSRSATDNQVAQVGEMLQQLIDQHTYLQPKAKHIIKDDPLLTNKDAWKKAYKDNVGGQRPLDAILQGLIRYCAYTGLTTHGAESAHSVADWLHPKRRASLKSKTKNDEMILVAGGFSWVVHVYPLRLG